MSTSSLSNRSICNAHFTKQDPDVFSCNTCAKAYRSTNGYTNLLSHLRRHHSAYHELARAALLDTNGLRLRVVDQSTVDIYRWVEWTVTERLPFTFCERPLVRANTKLSNISRGTLKLYMEAIQGLMEAHIKRDLSHTFGLVLDGWSDGGHHYIAIFAVYSDTETVGTGTGSRFSTGILLACQSRRFVLLAICPLDDEEDLGAQSLFDLIADTLSRYDKPWEAVAFMVGDNCSVNQCIGRKVGAVPLIGCASHRFNLAMKDYLNNDEDILKKIHALMKRLSTLKGRALLRKVCDLAPVLRNETRWSSTYEMVKRYSVIGPIIRTLDHDTLASNDIWSSLLSRRDHDKAVAMLTDLGPLEAVKKTLQRSSLTLTPPFRQNDRNLP